MVGSDRSSPDGWFGLKLPDSDRRPRSGLCGSNPRSGLLGLKPQDWLVWIEAPRVVRPSGAQHAPTPLPSNFEAGSESTTNLIRPALGPTAPVDSAPKPPEFARPSGAQHAPTPLPSNFEAGSVRARVEEVAVSLQQAGLTAAPRTSGLGIHCLCSYLLRSLHDCKQQMP